MIFCVVILSGAKSTVGDSGLKHELQEIDPLITEESMLTRYQYLFSLALLSIIVQPRCVNLNTTFLYMNQASVTDLLRKRCGGLELM